MTGTELLEALSFVDEKYIQEAETAKQRTGTPWMKLLSVAACLGILVVGAYALQQTQFKHVTTETAAAPAAPAATIITDAALTEEMGAPKEEASMEVPELPAEVVEIVPSGELQQVPYARLRVTRVLRGGSFEAIAEATRDMEVDTQVTVVVDPSKVPGAGREISNDLSVIVVDAVFEIYDGAYDAENNLLYVSELCFPSE